MATSPDGINWTKYDDPDTTEAPTANSDPVKQPSVSGWDSTGIHCSVLKTDTGWDMFFAGWQEGIDEGINYASSADGVHWSKYHNTPFIHDYESNFPFAVKFGSTYYLYYFDWDASALGVRIGTIMQP